jgi:hypothetical protein
MNTARIAVAEATLTGDVGVAKAETETRERTAQYDRQATVEENKQKEEIWRSKAALAKTQAEAEQLMNPNPK